MCRIEYADDEGGMWHEELHEVTGRKEHRCDDCGRTIVKGERYTRGVWLMPREGFTSVAMCQQCVTAGLWLVKVCGGHFWPGVSEELEEHWDEEDELRSHGLGRLIAVGKRKWQRNDGLVPVDTVRRWVDMGLSRVPAGAMH